MSRFVYLDNAATTSTKKEVVDAMYPFFTESFGNPSSVYDFAAKNKKAVNDSRPSPMRFMLMYVTFTLPQVEVNPTTGH